MLVLTEAAAETIDALTARSGLPDSAGLRISTMPGGERAAEGWNAALTAGPGPMDEVFQVRRGRLYLEPEAAGRLADKVLDAQTAQDGEVIFHVRQQDEETLHAQDAPDDPYSPDAQHAQNQDPWGRLPRDTGRQDTE
jgi:Fe-S cluster assembly iron-binding protein IscA